MNADTFAVLFGCIACVVWLLFGIGRLTTMLAASGVKAAELRRGLVGRAQRMVQRRQQLQAIDEAIKQAETDLAAAKREQEEKKRELAAIPPPPPDEIEVQAEFPPSRRDKPYVLQLKLSKTSREERPDLTPERWLLFWALDQDASVSRARQVASTYAHYEVGAIRRFS